MREEFIKRQSKRADNIENLINKYGSIDKIPIEEKDKIIKEAKKDLPLINGMHISILNQEMRKIRKELILIEIGWLLLSLAMLFKGIIK